MFFSRHSRAGGNLEDWKGAKHKSTVIPAQAGILRRAETPDSRQKISGMSGA